MKKLMGLCLAVFAFSFAQYGYTEPPNLSLVKSEVIQYHDSGAYHKELSEVIAKARAYIKTRVALNQRKQSPEKLALVLDIDETSLSNYPYMIKRDFVANREILHKEVLEASAPAIRPMVALFNEAKKAGVTVFFVTGRPEPERDATIKNLHRAGFKGWKALMLKPPHYQQKSIVPFKSGMRKKITDMGYTVIASIGDQCSDLKGGYVEKGFKLPNPYYYLP